MLTLTKIDPKVKEQIQSIVELNKDNVYLLEISSDITRDQFLVFADSIKKCFDDAGLKCLVAPSGLIENIYELNKKEGGKN